MQELINFRMVNAIPKDDIQIVSTFRTRADQTTGEPYQMVLKVALDRIKAESNCCEFPVYIPAIANYKETEHLKMLEIFRSGAPWVPIRCHDFKMYRRKCDDYYEYFALARSFTVVDYSELLED